MHFACGETVATNMKIQTIPHLCEGGKSVGTGVQPHCLNCISYLSLSVSISVSISLCLSLCLSPSPSPSPSLSFLLLVIICWYIIKVREWCFPGSWYNCSLSLYHFVYDTTLSRFKTCIIKLLFSGNKTGLENERLMTHLPSFPYLSLSLSLSLSWSFLPLLITKFNFSTIYCD